MNPFEDAIQSLKDEGNPMFGTAVPSAVPSPTETPQSHSVGDYTVDALLAPLRGVVAAGGSAYDLADYLSGDLLPDQEFKKAVFGDKAESVTLPGQIIEGISEFATGFLPGLGIVGKAGKLAKASKIASVAKLGGLMGKTAVKGALAGGLSDFVAFDPHSQRLSNLLSSIDNPLLNNAVTQYLSAQEGDSQLEGRFKNAIEGVGIGAMVDTLWAGLRAFKARKGAIEAGLPIDEVERRTAEAVKPEEIKRSIPEPEAPKTEASAVSSATQEPKLSAEGQPKVEETAPASGTPLYSKSENDRLTGIMRETARNYIRNEGVGVQASNILGEEVINPNFVTARQEEEIKKLFNFTTYRQGNDRIMLSAVEAAKEELKQVPMTDKTRYNLAVKLANQFGKNDPEAFLKELNLKTDAMKDLDVFLLSARMMADNSFAQLKKAAELAALGKGDAELNAFIEQSALHADTMLKLRAISNGWGKTGRSLQTLQRHLQKITLKSSGTRNDILGVSLKDLNAPGAMDLARQRIAQLNGRDALIRSADRLNMAFASGNLKAVNDLIKQGRWINAHNEFWINALLSGPKTALVNAIGNSFTTLYLPLEGAVGAVRKGNMGLAKEYISRYGYLVEAVNDSMKMARLAFQTNEPRFISETFTDPGMSKNAISADKFDLPDGTLASFVNGLGHYINMPTRFLMATDEFFKQINARASAKSMLMSEAMDFFANKGLTSEALSQNIGKYVADRMELLFDKTGQLFSKSKLYQEAAEEGMNAKLTGQALQDYVKEAVDAKWEQFGGLGKISEYAEKTAREATFQTELPAGGYARGIQDFVASHPTTRLVMPFTRTPINILKFAGQRMAPMDLPVLNKLHVRYMEDLASGDARRIAEATGRFWMGTGMTFSAAMLAIGGMITGGGPTNQEERKLLESTGWRPYSFRVGDKYISYQRLDPFATFFGLAADLGDAARRMDADQDSVIQTGLAAIGLAMTQNVVNKSYMAGLERFFQAATDPERFVPKLIKSQAGSYVPSIIAQSVPTFDPYAKDARSVLDAVLKRVPGMSGFVDKSRNILGEPIEVPLGRIPFGVDYLSPIVVSTDKKDKVMRELANLQYGFSMPKADLGGGIDLRDIAGKSGQSAYDRWLELHQTTKVKGVTLREALNRLISSSAYQRLSDRSTDKYDSPRIQQVRRIIRMYRDESLKQVFKEFPQINDSYNIHKRNKIALKRGISVDDLLPLK